MFEQVNYDWHLNHDDGSTDFSDDETLDDHPHRSSNGLRTPDKVSPNEKFRPNPHLSVYSPNNNNSPGKDYFTANTSDWSRSTPSDHGGDSPGNVDFTSFLKYLFHRIYFNFTSFFFLNFLQVLTGSCHHHLHRPTKNHHYVSLYFSDLNFLKIN